MPIRYANKILFNEVRLSLTDWGVIGLFFGDRSVFFSDLILNNNEVFIGKMIDMYRLESGDGIHVRGIKGPKAMRNRAVVMNISHYYK